jgi:hypothetical protein
MLDWRETDALWILGIAIVILLALFSLLTRKAYRPQRCSAAPAATVIHPRCSADCDCAGAGRGLRRALMTLHVLRLPVRFPDAFLNIIVACKGGASGFRKHLNG